MIPLEDFKTRHLAACVSCPVKLLFSDVAPDFSVEPGVYNIAISDKNDDNALGCNNKLDLFV